MKNIQRSIFNWILIVSIIGTIPLFNSILNISYVSTNFNPSGNIGFQSSTLKTSDNITITKKVSDYKSINLNNNVSFALNSISYCNDLRLNFTSINETDDFVENGDLTYNSDNWDAQNKTDIKYERLKLNKSISINLTGTNSKEHVKPLNQGAGIENFSDLIGWYSKSNNPSNFNLTRDPAVNSHISNDNTGSLKHSLKRPDANPISGVANTSHQFTINKSIPIDKISLKFYYKSEISASGENHEINLYIITPDKQHLYIEGSKITMTSSEVIFTEKSFVNISRYCNITGTYNLTFSTTHNLNINQKTTIWFDDIELDIVYKKLEIQKNTELYWNQSIPFNRQVFTNGNLRFTYFMSNLFRHVNSSENFLSIRVNGQQYLESLQEMKNGTWISNSITIQALILQKKEINLSIGLFFNQQKTYIFPNETFQIQFDDISLTIGTNPTPSQINLKVGIPVLNESHQIQQDVYHNYYLRIFNSTSAIWMPGNIYTLNISCNSLKVFVRVILTYFIYQNINTTTNHDDNDDDDNIPDYVMVAPAVLLALLLMVLTSSSLFTIRIEKRLFLNPKYEYIKKLDIKKSFKKRDASAERKNLKPCSTCGKPINYRAKYCEYCGSPQ